MATKLITAPTFDAVHLDRIKQHLRVSHELEDDLLRSYATAATSYVETRTHQTIRETVFEDSFCRWDYCLELRHGPLISLDSVKYTDPDGNEQTVPSESFFLLQDQHQPAAIKFAFDDWPELHDKRPDVIRIRYAAGMASSQDAVPEDAKLVILQLVAHYDQNRSAVDDGRTATVPLAVDAIIQTLKQGYYA